MVNYYKFNNDSDNEKYCHIYHRHGHTTDESFLNPRRKDKRINKNPSNGNIRHQERSNTIKKQLKKQKLSFQ